MSRIGKKRWYLAAVFLLLMLLVCGCGKEQTDWRSEDRTISAKLNYEKSMELDYATEYAIDYYSDGFTLISISDGSRFLLNTEKKEVPGRSGCGHHRVRRTGIGYLPGCICHNGHVLQYRCTESH